MLQRNSPVPVKFILTIIGVIIVFVPLSGYLMVEFPARGEGINAAEWFILAGFAAILVFGAGGTIWYQWKAIRKTRRVPGEPARRRSPLERTGAIIGTIIYGAISITTCAVLAVAFTQPHHTLLKEFPVLMIAGAGIAVGTGFTAWMKWRGPVNYSYSASSELAEAESTQDESHFQATDLDTEDIPEVVGLFISPSQAMDPDTKKLLQVVRLFFALIACSIIGLLGTWVTTGILWLIGGDAAVSHYARAPW